MAENQTVGFRWPTINQLRDWPPETRGTNFAPLAEQTRETRIATITFELRDRPGNGLRCQF